MSNPVLKADHLGISFGGLKAVEGFDLEIRENELVGLIGPNGAGKTTVFNMLTGVYQPTEGAVYLDGNLMAGKKPHQMVKAGIARTFQNLSLIHISEPTRQAEISYAVFCLKKKKHTNKTQQVRNITKNRQENETHDY